jgi:hypothetical protein
VPPNKAPSPTLRRNVKVDLPQNPYVRFSRTPNTRALAPVLRRINTNRIDPLIWSQLSPIITVTIPIDIASPWLSSISAFSEVCEGMRDLFGPGFGARARGAVRGAEGDAGGGEALGDTHEGGSGGGDKGEGKPELLHCDGGDDAYVGAAAAVEVHVKV